MRRFNDTILNDSSITGDSTGETVELESIYGFSLQIRSDATSGGSGVLKVQVSNDGESWTELSSPTATITGGLTVQMLNIADTFYDKMRIFYDHTAGTVDSIVVVINGKGV